MKILYVNIPTGAEDSEFGDFAKNAYVPLMRKNIGLVKSPETEIVFRFCEWGMGPIDVAFYKYIDHLASRMVYYAARNAREEGFDAVVINCFGDPMLWELHVPRHRQGVRRKAHPSQYIAAGAHRDGDGP
jgi:hypothetical protein